MKNLKPLRMRLNLSQKELGDLLGVHVMTVSKWERGIAKPNDHQSRILRALSDAGTNGLRATRSKKGEEHDPIRFLAAALSQAYGGPPIDLGAPRATNLFSRPTVALVRR